MDVGKASDPCKGAVQIESGLQLVARLRQRSRPDLSNFQRHLFHAGLSASSTVEICGNPSSGKTTLLTEIVADCILPTAYEGLDRRAVLIDNDHQLQVSKMSRSMSERVRRVSRRRGVDRPPFSSEAVVREALENLTLISCFEAEQLTLTFARLESIMASCERTCAVAVDGLLAYYWQARRDASGVTSRDQYANSLLKSLRKRTAPFDALVVYTRRSERPPSLSKMAADRGVDYGIWMRRTDDNFVCEAWKVGHGRKILDYSIGEHGTCWRKREI